MPAAVFLVSVALYQIFLPVLCNYGEHSIRFVSQNFDPKLNSHVDQLIKYHWNQEMIYLYYGKYFTRADVTLHGFGDYFHQRSLDVAESRVNMSTLVNKRGGYVSFGRLYMDSMCETIENSWKENSVTLNWDNVPFTCSAYVCHFLKRDKSDGQDDFKNEAVNRKRYWRKKNKNKKKSLKDKEEEECDLEMADFDEWRPALYALRDLVAMEKFLVQQTLNVISECDNHDDPFMRHSLEEYIREPTQMVKEASGLITRLQAYQNMDDYMLGEYAMDKELAG